MTNDQAPTTNVLEFANGHSVIGHWDFVCDLMS
jgi:hypothetical protein